MERRPLLPEFYGSVFEGYAINFVKGNYWRVAASALDFEEAMAEACYCFYDTRMRYGRTTNSLPNFMYLYKRALSIWFTEWSNWDTRQRSVLPHSDIEPTAPPEATLVLVLKDAGKELSQVLRTLINAPSDLLEDLRKQRDGIDSKTNVDRVFQRAVLLSGVPIERAASLQRELIDLLS